VIFVIPARRSAIVRFDARQPLHPTRAAGDDPARAGHGGSTDPLGVCVFETAPFVSAHASTIGDTLDGLVAAWFGGTREGAADFGIWLSQHERELAGCSGRFPQLADPFLLTAAGRKPKIAPTPPAERNPECNYAISRWCACSR
jgi:hypothetical protein